MTSELHEGREEEEEGEGVACEDIEWVGEK
jgi:hypothetical protein